jgi:hypothetical protein
VAELTPDSALRSLQNLQDYLAQQFADLRDQRALLGGDAPVFALEHDLSTSDVDELQDAVRLAVELGFDHKYWRVNWLPFVVYAAELGFSYIGDEFWTTFESNTPRWDVYGDRTRVRIWFQRFASEYGGAIPVGAFAKNFSIIAWPITHAVLPKYLQRNLAHLLFEFRMGLTTDLLRQPEELGKHLAARAWDYTERFRHFCENTSLLGHVAAALLSGDDEGSPFLLQSTLIRVVEGLEQQSQAKYWLQGARRTASKVRARGLQPGASRVGGGAPAHDRLPNPTDPRLVLHAGDDGWRLYAELPDLSSLSRRLPHIYEELRTKRARIEGAEQTVLARGRLTTVGQEVRLTRWPDPDEPFVRLEDGDDRANRIIEDQVMISRGPIWLFKRRGRDSAVEVKGRLAHPGGTYYVAHDGSWSAPDVAWAQEVPLDVADAEAVRLDIPENLSEAESDVLVAAGLSVGSDVYVRPIGFTASAWDGEGAIEWLAGEPGLIGIRAGQIPSSFTLDLAGKLRTQPWPQGERDLYLKLEDLPVGEHLLQLTLSDAEQKTLTSGSLTITIRDPQVRAEGAEVGEGIRLLASPARPTMSELWESGAVSIVGPEGLTVELLATLRDEKNHELAKVQHSVSLPLREFDWSGVASKVRRDDRFARKFDQAESVELSVSRAGVGYASLSADRGFQPLRWQLIRDRDGNRAHLIDRTDSGATQVEMYRVEAPLVPVACAADAEVVAPATGGLLRATAGDGLDVVATVLLPTQPTDLLGVKRIVPEIQTGTKTPGEVLKLIQGYELWAAADLPGDVFAQFQRDEVLEAITRAAVCLVAGGRWTGIERQILRAVDPLDFINDLQAAIGDKDDQKRLAKAIGMSLHSWLDPVSLLTGFAEVIQETLRANNLTGHDSAPRFLLSLAGRVGLVANWPVVERGILLQAVVNTPLLVRAARFAVLGTRYLSEAESAVKGF